MTGIPLSYQILTNLDCNLDCDYCYENKCNKVNKVEDIKEFLNACFERDKDKDGDVTVDFIGGETFMYPGLVDEAIEHADLLCEQYQKQLIGISVTTNGTLLLREEVQALILKYKPKLFIGLSIDGLKANHDHHRIYKVSRKGSYDDVIAGAKWLMANLCPQRIGVKATFTKDTFDDYAESIISLIELGFIDIAGNLIFEDHYDFAYGMKVTTQLIKVTDYLMENNLQDKVCLFQLNNRDIEFENFTWNSLEYRIPENRNNCGSCQYMTCLGFDRKYYGCNRFCTMDKPGMELGVVKESRLVETNNELKLEVINQYQLHPTECVNCLIKESCPTCVGIPYEYDPDPARYISEKRMCGWTYGLVVARQYYAHALREKRKRELKVINDND